MHCKQASGLTSLHFYWGKYSFITQDGNFKGGIDEDTFAKGHSSLIFNQMNLKFIKAKGLTCQFNTSLDLCSCSRLVEILIEGSFKILSICLLFERDHGRG